MSSPLGRRIGVLAVGSLLVAGLGTAGATAAEPKNTSVITGSSDWYTQAYDNFPSGGYLTPQQADVNGPQRAPFGPASHRMTIGESSAQTELYRTNVLDGVALADLTRLEYSEYARSTSGGGDRQPVYLRLSVDTSGDGETDDSLFFYPSNNGDVTNGVWHHWDVANGDVDVNGDNGGTTTLADYAATHPGAEIVNDPYDEIHDAGGLSLIVGGVLGGDTDPQTRGEYFVDRVIVGVDGQDTLYDLGGGSETALESVEMGVTPTHDLGWASQAYDDVDYFASNQALVDGPGTPPIGGGSLRFKLDSEENDKRVELFRTGNFDQTPLRDLRELSYSTYVQADAGNDVAQQPPYLRLSLDTDGDGATDDSLFFSPANNGTVEQATWQSWDAYRGVWGLNGDPGPADSFTLADYLVAHPDASIVPNGDESAPEQPRGGFAVMVGAGGAGQMDGTYYVDKIETRFVDYRDGQLTRGLTWDLDPAPPTVSVGDVQVSEGNFGATLTFPVTLSRVFATDVTVDYATSDGGAVAGQDYVAKAGTVTIPAGSTTANIAVKVLSDRNREANEYLRLTLNDATRAYVADGVAIGRIMNDDTGVGFAAKQGVDHRVRASVTSVPASAGAPVKVFRVTKAGPQQVFFGHLNDAGRISVLMRAKYGVGATVTFYATVRTANGLYTSPRATVTIR